MIATQNGFNVYVCGNGGITPAHAVLLAPDVPEELAVKYLDRFLMFYVRTANHRVRTAAWLKDLDGGIEFLKKVVIDDHLGINDELEKEVEHLLGTYQCEWKEVLDNPELRQQFQQYLNGTGEEAYDQSFERVKMRDQFRPALLSKAQIGYTLDTTPITTPKEKWQWVDVGPTSNFLQDLGTPVRISSTPLAVFRLKLGQEQKENGERWIVTQQHCPNKRGFNLSGGIVGAKGEDPTVCCQLCKTVYNLNTGVNYTDESLVLNRFDVKAGNFF